MGEPTERDELFTRRLRNTSIQGVSDRNESQELRKQGCSISLFLAGCVTTIGGCLPAGYNIGVINAPSSIIKTFCNESIYKKYDIIVSKNEMEVLWSVVVSIFLVGGMMGSLSGSWLADKVGRKGAYIISTILGIMSALLFYGCKPAESVELLVIGRFLIGLAGGLTTTTVPMHLAELAPLNLRGMMGVLCPLGLTLGVLLAQILGLEHILGTKDSWHYLLAIYVILTLASSIFIPWLPESPKYLCVIKNKPEIAVNVLSKIRALPIEDLRQEIEDLSRSNTNSEVSWSIMSILKSREMLLPLLLTCSMQAGQQLSGINAVFYYSVQIFESAGFSKESSQLVNIGAGGMNLFMAIIAIFLNMMVNRRILILLSCFFASFFLVLLGLSVTLINDPNVSTWMPHLAIFAMLAYVFCYQLGLGPIPFFIGSELFEIGPRPSAMALGSMANWGANFIIGMSFPSLQMSIGASSFYIFAAITFMLLLFLRIYLPETRNKNTHEIAALCKNGFQSRPLDSPSSSITGEIYVP